MSLSGMLHYLDCYSRSSSSILGSLTVKIETLGLSETLVNSVPYRGKKFQTDYLHCVGYKSLHMPNMTCWFDYITVYFHAPLIEVKLLI
jgi:hypothetical protein